MAIIQSLGEYSYIGDFITLILAICILILVKQSLYFVCEHNFRLFKWSLNLVIIASLANILLGIVRFYLPNSVLLIYLCRDVYHVALLFTLLYFIVYIRNQLGLSAMKRKFVTYVSYTVVFAGIITDVSSPITHFGFYYADGSWHDDAFLKPFSMTYAYTVIMLALMIFVWGGKLIKQVRHTLIIIETIALVILLVEGMIGNNELTTFTFALPMTMILVLLHSKPYDPNSGAMDREAFENFLEFMDIKEEKWDFVVLELQLGSSYSPPEDIARAIHSVWYKFFKRVALFNVFPGTYVLAIEPEKKQDNLSVVHDIIAEQFNKYYVNFAIPYKIYIMPDVDYIGNIHDMYATLDHFGSVTDINTVKFIDQADREELLRMRYIVRQLSDISAKKDLNDERVLVYCQPIKNNKTGKFETGEVLMRMRLPELGMVFPDKFIPLAESIGVIHTLSLIILNKACVIMRNMLNEGYDIERVSVNFSVAELRSPNFCTDVLNIIESNNVPYEKIAIEITESQNDNDYKMVKERIDSLKRHGIRFYLDDFGTGYSNYDRVMNLGMDLVKFDRALLLYFEENASAKTTMKYFSDSFRNMNYKVLFEGVETEEHEKLCSECNADYLQGFKYSKPIPFEETRGFFSKAE